MNHDIPGYAYISGGDDNGKYIDGQGRLYRRQGDELIADNGAPVSVRESIKEGRIVGQVQSPATAEQIAAMQAEAAGGTHDSTEYDGAHLSSESLNAPPVEEKPATAEQLQNEVDGSPMSAPQGETSDEYKAQAEVAARADEILASRSPAEVRELLHAAKAAGVEVDILEDDDEVSVRLNAETLAAVAE